MNNEFISSAPYRILGLQLRKFREKSKESPAEVSGAIEIEETKLKQIELGKVRPSEDILLLLISHFNMQDDEALRIWDLAGYDQDDMSPKSIEESLVAKQLVMLVPVDNRIIYSDNLQVVANSNGVILNFSQLPGGPFSSQTVSRIGISREQAHKVIEVINEALNQSDKFMSQKQLPLKSNRTKKKNDQ